MKRGFLLVIVFMLIISPLPPFVPCTHASEGFPFQVTDEAIYADEPSWHLSGQKIVYKAKLDDWHRGIKVVDLGDLSVTSLTSGEVDEWPNYSPDGQKIAFQRWGYRGDYHDLMVMDADGQNVQRLTFGPPPGQPEGCLTEPRWSNDGQKILFHFMPYSSPGGYHHYIYLMDADGSPSSMQFLGDGHTPRWSPDNSKILYTYYTDPDHPELSESVYIMNSDGTNKERLTEGRFADMSIAGKIVFEKGGDLYIMDYYTRDIEFLLEDGVYPEWSPDGRCIAFRSTRSGKLDIWILEYTLPVAPKVEVYGGRSEYNQYGLEVFFRGTPLSIKFSSVSIGNHMLHFQQWYDRDEDKVVDSDDWVNTGYEASVYVSTSPQIITIDIPSDSIVNLHRIVLDDTNYVSNNFYIIFNPYILADGDNIVVSNFWENSEIKNIANEISMHYIEIMGRRWCWFMEIDKYFSVKTHHFEPEVLKEAIWALNLRAPSPKTPEDVLELFVHTKWEYFNTDNVMGEGDGINDILDIKDDVLTAKRNGDCRWFTSWGVAFLRAIGIPARAISGAGLKNNEDLEFRHAWVEAYYRGESEQQSDWHIYDARLYPHGFGTDEHAFVSGWNLVRLDIVEDEYKTSLGDRYNLGIQGRWMIIGLGSPVDLHIYDEKNRHIGINYETDQVEVEIPNASYTGPDTEPEPVIISIQSENYIIEIFGTDEGTYSLAIQDIMDGATITENNFTDQILRDVTHNYLLSILIEGSTIEHEPIIELQNLENYIYSLPDSAFNKNPEQKKKALFNKIEEVISRIETSEYRDAINKLENDILPKMDGNSTVKDWIIALDAQHTLLAWINQIVEHIN